MLTSPFSWSEISQINELATASQTYTVVEKVESNSKLFDTIDIPFSENFFILTYMGELKAGVNLDEAQVALEGTTVKVSLPQATILSGCHRHDQLQGAARTEQLPQPHRRRGRHAVHRRVAPRSGGCRHQRPRCSTRPRRTPSRPLKRYSVPALPEGYTIEVSSAAQNQTTE